jgi:mono/diheme cytochrome c family protein
MQRLPRTQLGVLLAFGSACLFLVLFVPPGPVISRVAQADPPADQEYTGVKRCASCHFEQFMAWRGTPHARVFDLLPPQYQKDPKCLPCHTTGYGEPSGFRDMATTPQLASVTCESCHGPGSEHEKISQPFAKVKQLTPEQEEKIRGSIWRILPGNNCLECHTTKGHHPSETPPALRKKR